MQPTEDVVDVPQHPKTSAAPLGCVPSFHHIVLFTSIKIHNFIIGIVDGSFLNKKKKTFSIFF